MKKPVFNFMFAAFVLLAFFFAGCVSGPSGGSLPTITIVNNTGYTVYYVNISPVSDTNWGVDWLKSDQVLEDGESESFQLNTPLSRANRYDIRLIDEDEDEYIKMNVLVRNNSRIVFTFDDIDMENFYERRE